MSTPALVYHPDIVRLFAQRKANGKLAHAYVLIAPQGAGKQATALAIAKMMNCKVGEEDSCGKCSTCMRIIAGQFPDVMVVAPEEETIKIEHIRTLLTRLPMRAFESEYKIVIIPDAHRMTVEAANALLKTLEEPTGKTLIMLTVSSLDGLLPTIASRCQWVRLKPSISVEVCRLLESQGVGSQEATLLARLSGGWRSVAQQWHDDGFYARLSGLMDALGRGGFRDEMIKELTDDPQAARETLLAVMLLVRDILVYQATQDENLLCWQEDVKLIKAMAKRPTEDIARIATQATIIKFQLDENLNAKMAWVLLKERLWNPLSK